MANLTFNIPDADMPRVIKAWGEGWQEEVMTPGTPGDPESQPTWNPNPQTKAQFAKEQIRRLISDRVRQYEALQAEPISITDN
jgi:hypothetical protein